HSRGGDVLLVVIHVVGAAGGGWSGARQWGRETAAVVSASLPVLAGRGGCPDRVDRVPIASCRSHLPWSLAAGHRPPATSSKAMPPGAIGESVRVRRSTPYRSSAGRRHRTAGRESRPDVSGCRSERSVPRTPWRPR